MIPYEWIEQAVERISQYLEPTPLSYDPNNDLYFKWENQQITGSFKLRGALNKILSLQPWEQERGLVTASAGNHGQGVAWAARHVGAKATVFASDHAVLKKVNAMRDLGAEIVLVDGGYAEAEQAAIEYAQKTGSTWISPYNDGQVIAGQATVALELLQHSEARSAATWVVPVGGGGLISGIGAALQHTAEQRNLVGAQSVASPYFHSLYYRGTQDGVVEKDSIADGLAGAVEESSLTIPLVRKYVSNIVLVNEDEICQAISFAWHQYGEVIEGSAAVSLAALLFGHIKDRPAVIVLSGGNIEPELHTSICQRFPTTSFFQERA